MFRSFYEKQHVTYRTINVLSAPNAHKKYKCVSGVCHNSSSYNSPHQLVSDKETYCEILSFVLSSDDNKEQRYTIRCDASQENQRYLRTFKRFPLAFRISTKFYFHIIFFFNKNIIYFLLNPRVINLYFLMIVFSAQLSNVD